MQPSLALWEIILIVAVSGFFGGLVSAIFDILATRNNSQSLSRKVEDYCGTCEIGAEIKRSGLVTEFSSFFTNVKFQLLEIIFKAFIGIAGAFGVLLLGYWLGQIKMDATVSNEIFLISLCIVAGTASFRLLPKIGSKLEEQFLVQKIEQSEKKVEGVVTKAVESTVEYSGAIAHAATAMGRDAIADCQQATERLERIRPLFKTDRTLHIYLGRLYRKGEKYDDAILVLRSFIKNRNESINKGDVSITDNVDLADAYFNIACYHVLKAQELESTLLPAELERLKNEAIDTLHESIKLWPKNKEYARTDRDFKYIEHNEKFKYLVS